MDGQFELTDYFKTGVDISKVMDLTSFINSQGKAQYTQVKEIVSEYVPDRDIADRLTNAVSVYILRQSGGYMKYLKEQA